MWNVFNAFWSKKQKKVYYKTLGTELYISNNRTIILSALVLFFQVTKSVIALLDYYKWHKFTIIFEETWKTVAHSLHAQAKYHNMTVNNMKEVTDRHKCCENGLPCCDSLYWYKFIQDTRNKTRSNIPLPLHYIGCYKICRFVKIFLCRILRYTIYILSCVRCSTLYV